MIGKRILAVICLAALLPGCSAPAGLRLPGTVEYTQYDISAQAGGMVTAVSKAEGDAVRVGDAIAAIDSAVQQAGVQQAQALVRAKESRLAELKAGSREEQLAQAEAALKAASAKYDDLKKGATSAQIAQAQAAANAAGAAKDTARATREYAKSRYAAAKDAFDTGRIGQDKLDEAQLALDTAQGQYDAASDQYDAALAQLAQIKKGPTADSLRAAQAAVEQAQAQLDLLKNGSTDYAIAQAQADLDAAGAQLSQAQVLLARCSVTAPVAGTLSILNLTKGGMVSAGGYAATIADPDDVWMYAYIRQSQLRYVSLGQQVRLDTGAWPGETFEGTIVYIADEAEFTPKNTQTDESKENTVFKLKIALRDPAHKLRAGMTMAAAIPLQ